MNFNIGIKQRFLFFAALLVNSFGVMAGVPIPPPPPMSVSEECLNVELDLDNDIEDDAECSEVSQGNQVIEGDSIRYSTTNTTNTLGAGIRSGLGGSSGGRLSTQSQGLQRQSGLAAGSGFNNVSTWANFNRIHSSDDLISTAYDTSTNSGLFGVDFVPMENMVLGIAFGYEDHDTKTKFNTGNQDISGYTIAPYMGYLINDTFSFDISFGYSDFDIDQTRTDNVTGTLVNGDTESDRWFTSFNLNAFTTYNNWFLSGRVGFVYAEEDQDGYAETGAAGAALNPNVASQTIEFGQFQIGGEAAYAFGNMEPFFAAYYEHDFEREDVVVNAGQIRPENDEDDIRFSAGVRYFSTGPFSGVLQWDTILDRADFDSNTLSFYGRYEF